MAGDGAEKPRLNRRDRRKARLEARRRRRAQRRAAARRLDLKKAMFVLPNLFTVSSIFCGFYAITLCLDSPEPIHLRRAAIAIFFGMFFDMFDGRVARMTRTQSEFGVQLDSLADLVTFGCAPAILMYRWSLQELQSFGLVAAFLYLVCGALRLARFNVMAAHGGSSSKHFVGLPIPLAAGTVVALVLASYPFDRPTGPDGPIEIGLTITRTLEVSFKLVPSMATVVAVILGLLMVSNVRYRSFKDFKPTKKSITLVLILAVFLALVSARIKPAVALCLGMLGYIVGGLVEEVVFFRSRSEERRAARAERTAPATDEESPDPTRA